ncbi:MAG: ABC transporter permease [Deltaproteobacteria bacterium]|jgi:NitT/TauT family transport system permease protein|nr:ABC transporter permease [Deltaproteobacteria bacterium]
MIEQHSTKGELAATPIEAQNLLSGPAVPPSKQQPEPLLRQFMGWYGIIGFLIIWQLAPMLGLCDPLFIPPPTTIGADALSLVSRGDLFIHAATSAQRALLGLVAALAVAIPLAIFLSGWLPRFTRFINPLLSLLASINPFALFPLFILLFGVGELAKFAIIFWSSLFPVLTATINGVGGVNPLLVKTAKSMGASRATIFRKVVIPASLPSLLVGLRMGATTAFLFLIAAEMLAANAGLGWLVHNSAMNNYIPRIYVGVVTIALMGLLLSFLIDRLEAVVLGYKEEVKTN